MHRVVVVAVVVVIVCNVVDCPKGAQECCGKRLRRHIHRVVVVVVVAVVAIVVIVCSAVEGDIAFNPIDGITALPGIMY